MAFVSFHFRQPVCQKWRQSQRRGGHTKRGRQLGPIGGQLAPLPPLISLFVSPEVGRPQEENLISRGQNGSPSLTWPLSQLLCVCVCRAGMIWIKLETLSWPAVGADTTASDVGRQPTDIRHGQGNIFTPLATKIMSWKRPMSTVVSSSRGRRRLQACSESNTANQGRYDSRCNKSLGHIQWGVWRAQTQRAWLLS